MADIDFPADLLELERSAWAEHQRGELTVESAAKVQAGVTALAKTLKANRYEVEMALKKAVRHAEIAA
ncbi:hypothetical protein GCM10010099_22440 [Streptomyces cinereus]|nr:hypothetical protein GCM10010099_22440 [Streptomyces cinereus]